MPQRGLCCKLLSSTSAQWPEIQLLSSGHLIGEIIDDLSSIAYQVETRCKLGFTDLNRLLEDFFKDFLNRLLDLNLINLNRERLNSPGLDIADSGRGWAFQVTSQNNATKVNDTLKALTDEQVRTYSKIHVLIIGRKKKAYALDEGSRTRAGFSQEAIWDITDLCKRTLDVPLVRLEELYQFVRSEVARVTIELETPDAEGKFPTSISDYMESIPTPRLSNFQRYREFHLKQHPEYDLKLEDVQSDFSELIDRLRRLPRITREFYTMLLERRDEERHSARFREGLKNWS
jgi:hypothetical protein